MISHQNKTPLLLTDQKCLLLNFGSLIQNKTQLKLEKIWKPRLNRAQMSTNKTLTFHQFKCKINIQVILYWLPLLGFMPQYDINIKLSASPAYILPVIIVYSRK